MEDISGFIRVWWIPQVPMPAFRYTVPNIETGKLLCDALAKYDMFQYENNVKPDYANVGGIEFLDDEGEWSTLDPDDEWEVEWVEQLLTQRRLDQIIAARKLDPK